MKQDYPGPIPATKSSDGVATDAQSQGGLLGDSPAASEPLAGPMERPARQEKRELTDKRTATSDTTINEDGSYTTKQYFSPRYFQRSGNWESIDSTLIEDKNAGDASNPIAEAYGWAQTLFSSPTHFIVKDNEWQARFAPSDFEGGMLRIKKGDSQVGFEPVGAKKVAPVVTTDENGRQVVHYYDLWPGVNVEYIVLSAQVKENIIIKDKDAASQVSFRVVGATLQPGKDGAAFAVKGVADDRLSISPVNLILNNYGLVTDGTVFGQTHNEGVLTISVDEAYLSSLPSNAFPVVIDPGVTYGHIGTRAGGTYESYKSDGYVCPDTVCNVYAGSLTESGGAIKYWRGVFYAPYDLFQNPSKKLLTATLHIEQLTGQSFWTGNYDPHWFTAYKAACWGYNCMGTQGGSAQFATIGNIDVTNIYQSAINASDFGTSLLVAGEEWNAVSFKNFYPDYTYVIFNYNTIPAAPGVLVPSTDQVFTDPSVTFQVSPATDGDGDSLQYFFRIATGSDAETGVVVNSGNINGARWTIPDGILQDGTTYYLHAYSWDGYHYSIASPVIPFRIDSRFGRDKTQTYDDAGGVSVGLSTGNVAAGANSHTSAALGGSLGVGLGYNSPLRSRSGLVGEYWNNTSFTGTPVITRVDPNVDFTWDQGSPSAGVINNDNFSARWTGYFVAPATGNFQFGAVNDDTVSIWVNGTQVYSNSGCYSNICYGSGTVALTAGQVVTFKAEFTEATGWSYARLFVKGAVPEQSIAKQWLQTGVRPVQNQGLTGRYYTDSGSHNLDASGLVPFLVRNDSLLSFNWPGAPIPGAPENFMTRWTGYINLPVSGSYQFGTTADDGSRVKIDENEVMNNWSAAGTKVYGSGVQLSPGLHKITVDHWDGSGNASMYLYVKGAVPEQVVPSSWLSSKAQVLPDGWSLGVDADGNISYDSLRVNQNSVVLSDSSGNTHEYTWTGSAYKPPVNEDGQLIRNADGTYTLQDVDGRTYIFNSDGTLSSVISAVDDRNPAALKYTYSPGVGGGPARLSEITDGVTNGRYARVYYSGDTECGSTPSGFVSAPTGMLCAVITNDGRATYFYYDNKGQLARVAKPGNENLDYGYEELLNAANETVGFRLAKVRDSLASDAVAAGVRANDDTVTTQIAYDILGRASSVTAPADTAGASRLQKTYEYSSISVASWSTPVAVTNDLPTGSPVMTQWGPGKLAMTARFGTSLKYRFYQDGIWGDWQVISACLQDDPAISSIYPDRLDIFVRGCDNQLYGIYYANKAWSVWTAMGSTSLTSSPALTSWGSYRYDLAARGPSNELMTRNWTSGVGWNGFTSLGGCISQAPGVASWGYNRVDFFAVGCGSPASFYQRYWDNGWANWAQLTSEQNLSSAPQSVSTFDKKIHIVARGANGDLRYLYYNGIAWESWQTMAACIVGSPAIAREGDTIVIAYKGCDGVMYQLQRAQGGSTKVHVTGATEPNGYTRKIDYDLLYRTVKDYDKTGQITKTEWNPVRDLLLSTTDAIGLKSTTIYDDDDRPTDNYGPAPAAWFDTDRKPLAAYASQVPRTETKYDEGIAGPAVSWYNANNKSLVGAPKLHTTGFSASAATLLSRNFSTDAPPVTPDSGNEGYGFRATGKVRFPGSGAYTLKLFHDDGARLLIGSVQLVDDWEFRSEGTAQNTNTVTFIAEAGQVYNFRMDYYHVGNPGAIGLCIAGPGISDQSCGAGLGSASWTFLSPAYNLPTSTKVYDSTIGDTTNVINYGSNPALGLAQSSTLDPTGLNLTTSMTYETQGASGSFLRQTGKTLPGGGTTNYAYYTATETKDDPCTTGTTEAYKQAGFIKTKTEADPDGGGSQTSRVSETIYDDAGRTVASRYNADDWTCTTYDTRGRVTQTVVPTINGRSGRTVTTNYSYQSSPLKVQVVDSVAGTIVSEIDLLGRPVSSTDVFGSNSTVSYDSLGRVSSKTTPIGTESYTYDNYNRVTEHKLGGTTYATITYDAYSRVDEVVYDQSKDAFNNKLKLDEIKRDTLQRNAGAVFRFSNAATFDETVTRTQSGVVSGYTDTFGGNSAGGAYTYDKAGRLTAATINSNTYSYGYGAPSGCSGTYNSNAHKNSNRTSFTVNGNTTTYCYDYADRLIASSDVQLGAPTYDDHGNTVTLAGNGTPITFTYDAMDSNTAVEQGVNKVTYLKTASGSVLRKKEYTNSTLTKSYRYLAGGAVLQSCSLSDDNDCTTTDTYLSLPGGTTLTLSPTNPDTTKRTIYSIKNHHGDTAITANELGLSTSSVYLYEPFGMPASSSTFGTNSNPTNATDQNMGWAANPNRKVAGAFSIPIIQMGARVYLPTTGRFLQVDPIEGGTPNSYVYPNDPINTNDYSGKATCSQLIGAICGLLFPKATGQVTGRGVVPSVATTNKPRSRTSTPVRLQTPKVQTIAIAPPSPTLRAGDPKEKVYEPKRWDWGKASSSAYDWGYGGALAGGLALCGLGAVPGGALGSTLGPGGTTIGAGVGCMASAPVGVFWGAVVGAPVGFVLGGLGLPGKGAFEWGPDQLITPW